MTELAQIHSWPTLERPVLVMALEGWIDAGLGAGNALLALLGSMPHELIATFDGDELIDFRARAIPRPAFQKIMADRGIGTGVHYPSIPSLKYYRTLGYRDEDTPVAARVGRETVTLPLFPAMSDDDVVRVCRELRDVLKK